MLEEYEGWPGIGGATEAVFGFSGHRTKPEGLLIENYVERVKLSRTSVIKTIVDPEETVRCLSPHHFEYRPGTAAVDENGHAIRGHRSLANAASRSRVNHYDTKSEEEFRRKCATPDAANSKFQRWPDLTNIRWTFSQVTDTRLREYGPAVREAISKAVSRTPRSPIAVAAGTIETRPAPAQAAGSPARPLAMSSRCPRAFRANRSGSKKWHCAVTWACCCRGCESTAC